jgi:hypothetical protein
MSFSRALLVSFFSVRACAEGTEVAGCFSKIADTICLEKHTGFEAGVADMEGMHIVDITLWNDDQIKIITDQNLEQKCEIRDDLILVNLGKNRAIIRPTSLSSGDLEYTYQFVLDKSGRSILADCDL